MEWLVAAGHQPVHSYLPDSDTVRDSCLADVDGCDLYVLIVGHRYGFQPAQGNPEGLSITHLEFRGAGQSGKPRIALLRTSIPDVALSDLADLSRLVLVSAFREEVAREVRPAEFGDLRELIQGLSTGVQSALNKLSPVLRRRGGSPSPDIGSRIDWGARYAKSVEQLGSAALDIRIGGIYALERVAQESPSDHPAVMEVLATFVRQHSREQWPPPGQGRSREPHQTRPDVQAALTVIGRRDHRRDRDRIDLTNAAITWANLKHAHLSKARLVGADLDHTNLTGADLSCADLYHANLTLASFEHANLSAARLHYATLFGTGFEHANLTNVDFSNTDPVYVRLIGADLTNACWPGDSAVPEGWQRDTDTGCLRQTSSSTGGVIGAATD